MKLHITRRDLSQLSHEQLERLGKTFPAPYFMLQTLDKTLLSKTEKPNFIEISHEGNVYVYFSHTGEFYALPSIGQMLEFLLSKVEVKRMAIGTVSESVCDSLWTKTLKQI